MNTNRKRPWGCYAIPVAMIVLIVVIIMSGGIRDSQAAAPFKGMKELAQAACAQGVETQLTNSSPYRTGKVLVVHTEGDTVGHTMAEKTLVGILAVSPEEVGTLICVGEKERHRAGTYNTGAAAYRLDRSIWVIDLATGDVIYKTILGGSSPPQIIRDGDSDTGDDPEYRVLTQFILKLPEKTY